MVTHKRPTNIRFTRRKRLVIKSTKKGVVGKHETGCVENPDIMVKCYTFNPFIISRGVKLNRTIIALFEKTGWKDLCCNYIATEV